MKNFKILLFLVPFGLSAQDTTNTKFKHWAVGYTISPDYCYRQLTSDGSASSKFIVSDRNVNEKAKYGITTGFNACYFFKKHFSLETGINYSNSGYQAKDFNTLLAPDGSTILVNITTAYNYNFIEMPIKANFILGSKKLRFIASAGIINDFFVNSTETQTTGNSSQTVSSASGFGLIEFIALSAGADIKLNKFNLRIEPVCRYNLGLRESGPIKEHLWSAGLNFGLYYRI